MALFSGSTEDHSRKEKALNCALDIRKFEIGLYWKRATYFWTLIAAAFAGYFAMQSSGHGDPGSIFLVACIGLLLSVAWYLVNRGSKFWQENWEKHVDILEDEVIGPLYKTTIAEGNYSSWNLFGGYPYSVSKINQITSLFVVLVWLGLVFRAFPKHLMLIQNTIGNYYNGYYWALLVTLVFAAMLLKCGLKGSEKKPRTINLSQGDLEDGKG